jgi:photosystem II stability/assembly factor-like uncharacterized protein
LALSRSLGGGKLFKTSDGGKTWAEIVTDERFYAIALTEEERGLLVSNKNLYFVSRRSKSNAKKIDGGFRRTTSWIG